MSRRSPSTTLPRRANGGAFFGSLLQLCGTKNAAQAGVVLARTALLARRAGLSEVQVLGSLADEYLERIIRRVLEEARARGGTS